MGNGRNTRESSCPMGVPAAIQTPWLNNGSSANQVVRPWEEAETRRPLKKVRGPRRAEPGRFALTHFLGEETETNPRRWLCTLGLRTPRRNRPPGQSPDGNAKPEPM